MISSCKSSRSIVVDRTHNTTRPAKPHIQVAEETHQLSLGYFFLIQQDTYIFFRLQKNCKKKLIINSQHSQQADFLLLFVALLFSFKKFNLIFFFTLKNLNVCNAMARTSRGNEKKKADKSSHRSSSSPQN